MLTCGVEVKEHDVCLPVVLNTKNTGRLTCGVGSRSTMCAYLWC